MNGPAVAVTGLTKVFPVSFRRQSIVAVRDLDLQVKPGEVYGLLGPNGSGKSTTLKIILGLVSPTRGHTEIFGRDSRLVESREAVGFLPENPYFYKFLTGAETLRFFGQLCGLSGALLKKRVDEMLELVGLTDARDRRLRGYSKGMLQRIGLAQALINEPRLVVLDEPTAGVDPAGSRRDSRSDCRPSTTRDHGFALIALARASPGSLRSGRHPREWRARARGTARGTPRHRKSNRARSRKRFRQTRQ